MGNELKLPPRRPLPPAIRGRIRARALPGHRPARTRFPHARGPFAVAAGVAVLAAGAMIVTQSVNGGAGDPGKKVPPTGSSTSARPLDVRAASTELDRCWEAIRAEGKTDRYPDRSRWRAVSTGNYAWVTITAAFADNKPIFCQTGITTVRVSEPTGTPAAVPLPSTTAALFVSPEGVLAGIRDPSWPGVSIFTGDGSSSSGSSANLLPHGLFVDLLRVRVTDATKIEADPWINDRDRAEHPERFALPHPPAPVSRVDRPGPAADRISDRGRWLQECLDKSHTPVTDPELWTPGAIVAADGAKYMVVRAGHEFAYCFTDTIQSTKDGLPNATRWAFGRSMGGMNDVGKVRPEALPAPTSLGAPGGERQFVTGAVPSAVTKLEIVRGGDQVIQADLWNNTFAALLPGPSDKTDVVRAYDNTGNMLYQGSLY